MREKELRNRVFLCLLFSGTPQKIESLEKIADKDEVAEAMEDIGNMLIENQLPLRVVDAGGGYRLGTDPFYDDFIRDYFRKEKRIRLSKAGFDVLTIIAYKQPVTIPEINQIRGINSEGPIKTLLEKDMIEISGRKDSLGRPLLFKTAERFLEVFGLKSLDDLPKPIEINMLKQGLDNEDY